MNQIQLDAFKAAILAEASLAAAVAAGQDGTVADFFNQAAIPQFNVWRSSTPANDIADAINWQNLTPSDAADGTATFTNRALVCQAKQINIQVLLQGKESVNSARSNIRAGFQDALTNIPSGVGGASATGGWAAVKATMTRAATRAEKLFATGTGTQANPADLGWEGTVSSSDVAVALRGSQGNI